MNEVERIFRNFSDAERELWEALFVGARGSQSVGRARGWSARRGRRVCASASAGSSAGIGRFEGGKYREGDEGESDGTRHFASDLAAG